MKSQNTFRPAILHPASLITLFTISLVLIGLVEYACRTLPSVDDPIFAPKQRRGSTDIQHIYTTTQDYNIFKTITVVETRLANQHRQIDSQPVVPALESNLSLSPNLPVTDYESDIHETSTFTPCDSCPEFTAASSAYLRIETSTATTTPVPTFPTPADSAYLRIETATTIPVPISTAASSAYLRIETSTATTNTNATSPAPNSYLRKQNGHIGSTWDYIQGAYLPTLLSVIFTVPWVILSRVTASMEPFYCLASPSGAAAERALTVSMISPISPLLAIESGQWTRPLTVLLAVLSALITPLAPETIGIQTIGKCDHTTLGCTGRIRVFVPGARIIQALLAVMASSTIIVLILQRHKKWVSSSDPRSIAALAATLWGTGIRSNSKTLSAATHKNHMKQLLEGFRYKFVSETQNDGSTRVCLVSIQTGPQNSTRQDQKSQYPALHNESHIVPVIARRRFSSIAFLFLLIGLTAVILTYHYTSGDTGFENFMSGQGFGVQFLLTGVGVIISFYWRFVFQGKLILSPA
ncbi:hypothetical protein AA0113_g10533 [Alternaria arborescens]|uniref:Uncharacterized protein n=1 Tax=Alternaria arborescens TaxID=156630 RepID=A0A4Q4QPA2_9PLEO|nr:hypothetical protein AA0113_g10533 [Alternaria arborescens]